MIQLQKYTWLIDTIRRAGRISLEEISARWERNKDLSDYRPLSRATFNRWKEAIYNQFGIIIACQRTGGYLYYIENPEEIDDNELKKWMLDSFSVGNLIGEHLSLRDRILVSPVPSAHRHLSTLLEAMNDNRTVAITYCGFNKSRSYTFPVEPYCVKLFEGRWYVLARDVQYDELRIYGLDRIERIEPTGDTFKLPKGPPNASRYASTRATFPTCSPCRCTPASVCWPTTAPMPISSSTWHPPTISSCVCCTWVRCSKCCRPFRCASR